MLKPLLTILVFVIFVCGVRSQTPICAIDSKTHKPKNCCSATSFADCPLIGCGGDSKLNAAKNRTDDATSPERKTVIQMANFTRPKCAKRVNGKKQKCWPSGASRDLLRSWGEGKAVDVMLYLIKVTKYPDGAESCNCNLTNKRNNDFHLVLVEKPTQKEGSSLTAEITPRIRPDGWTSEKLDELAKKRAYVHVTGWAMLDTQHVGTRIPKRKTHWEIHPVTRFEVCTTTKAECDAGTGWKPLESLP